MGPSGSIGTQQRGKGWQLRGQRMIQHVTLGDSISKKDWRKWGYAPGLPRVLPGGRGKQQLVAALWWSA